MRPILLIALAGALLLSFAPTTQAVEYSFGTSVGSSDYDLSPLPSVSGADLRYALCVVDHNGNGVAEAEDYILLVLKTAVAGTCPANLNSNPGNALLLNTLSATLPAGTEIKGSHEVAGSAFTSPAIGAQHPHAIRYYEEGTDASKLDGKDALYLDLRGVAAGTPMVAPGDLRLSPVTIPGKGSYPGGTLVKAGDADESRLLLNIRPASAPATKLLSTANMVYKAGSGYYVNADFGTLMGVGSGGTLGSGDFGVESGDVRLNPKAANPLSDRPAVSIQGLSLSSLVVRPGEVFQLSVLVKNDGKAPGSGLVKTSFNGFVDSRGSPTLYPAETATLVLSFVAPLEEGRYPVKAGETTIFLDVEGAPVEGASFAAASTDTAALAARIAQLEARLQERSGDVSPASADSAQAGIPGVAPTVVILVLLGLVALARRKA